MEKLKTRLKYYGIGFGLGIIMVFFFFQNRGCSWLPDNRVKNSVLDRCLVISDESQVKLNELNLDVDDIIQVLNDGDVLFSESQRDSDPKIFLIEKEGNRFAFTLPKESFISEVFVGVKSSKLSPTTKGQGVFIHFPKDEHLVFPDTTSLVTCQQLALNLEESKKIFGLIKESGKIDFEKSDLSIEPKPVHYLSFLHEDQVIGARAIWYKNKINISTFETELVKDCK